MWQKYYWIFIGSLCVIVAGLLLLVDMRSQEHRTETQQSQEEQVQTNKSEDIVVVKEENEKYIFDIEYPRTPYEKLNIEVEQFVRDEVAQFKSDIESFDADIITAAKYSMYISYTIYETDFDIYSVELILSPYHGGAHPNHYVQTYVYDIRTNEILVLESALDINKLEKVADLVYRDFKQRDYFNDFDHDWFVEGTEPNSENYQNFIFTNNGLKFIFPPYQVAPYALGIQEVELTWNGIQEILAENIKNQVGL